MMRLKDKVAIVTGGAQGIGREYSLRFVEEGAAVGVVDTRFEQAKMVEQEIIDRKGKALAIRTDVTSKEQLDAMAKQVFDRFGRIDILVNNAAIYYDLELGNSSIEYGRKVIDVNVFGVMLASWAVFPYMKRQRSGSIINISSIAAYPGAVGSVMLGHMPDIETPTADYYGISKVAVIHLTQSMALSFGQYNIRVNAIAPGVTMSEATKKVVPQPFIQALTTQSALGRALEPGQLTGTAVYLASEDSAMMTGQVLVVDSGRKI
jgi:3-oxoacyl-[acyl-carrier protein] reductase